MNRLRVMRALARCYGRHGIGYFDLGRWIMVTPEGLEPPT